MPSADDYAKTVKRYLELVANGSADDVTALYAEDATIEDPIGSELRQGRAAIHEFYAAFESAEKQTELASLRVGGNEAAFLWSLKVTAGDSGTVVDLHVGDVVVIPAGVAHKGEAASPDLLIVGAYPGGGGPDMRIPGKGDREQALANIAAVPPPATDPVCGRPGPLIERWRTGVQR